MYLARNTILILVALFIDGLQAAISWGIAMIAAFPGTAAGGAIGCVVGESVLGQIGCWAGGAVLGILGTTGNALLAPATIPVGIAIGLAVNVSLSIVLGWFFLVPLMFFFGMQPQKRLWWSGAEIIPGINNVPCWFFFTLSCAWATTASSSSRSRLLGFAGFLMAPVRGIMQTKEDTGNLLGTSVGLMAEPASPADSIEDFDGAAPAAPRTRTVLQDIRSSSTVPLGRVANDNNRPYAKAA